MVVKTKTVHELNEVAFQRLVQDTDITAINPGSIARALVESVNLGIQDLFEGIELAVSQTFISQAQGFYLDLIGELFNVSRRTDVRAATFSDDQQIRFYVRDGALGDRLVHPTDATKGRIPNGTQIQNSDGSIVWTVNGNHDFDRTANQVYVGAQASTAGVQGNVGAKTLTSHNLGVDGVLVENVEGIQTGVDVEPDELFRVRIQNFAQSSQGSNETAVRLAVLQAPGVANVLLTPNVAGSGSFQVLVIPEGNRVSTNTLLEVSSAMRAAAAYGITVLVTEPEYLPFSITIKLSYQGTDAGFASVQELVEAEVRDYFANLNPGDPLIINRLRQLVLGADQSIEDLKILELCIDGRPQLVQNYQLANDELFIPDANLADPIRIV